MKTNRLLVAAVLATAIGAPIAGFKEDMNMPQSIDIPRGTGSVPSRASHGPIPVKPSWLLLSARTSGSIRRP